jgi:hypothetical protein
MSNTNTNTTAAAAAALVARKPHKGNFQQWQGHHA